MITVRCGNSYAIYHAVLAEIKTQYNDDENDHPDQTYKPQILQVITVIKSWNFQWIP